MKKNNIFPLRGFSSVVIIVFVSRFLKHNIILKIGIICSFITLLSASVIGQTVTVVDGATIAARYAVMNEWTSAGYYSLYQHIYKQSLINQSGSISSIQFEHTANGAANTNMKIYMGEDVKTSFTGTSDWINSGLTEVYSGTITTASGWYTITLTTPFTYSNTNSLIVVIHMNNGTGPNNSGYYHYYGAGDANVTLYNYGSSSLGTYGSWSGTGYTRQAILPSLKLTFVTTPGLWKTTAASTSWNTGSNWDDGNVPTSTVNVSIPSGCTNWPVIDVNPANCQNLSIASGSHLSCSANNTLNVYGNWSVAGTGYFDATAGTVVFIKTGTQSVTMTTNTDDHFYNLITGDGAIANIVNLGSTIDVNGALTINVNSTLDVTASNHNITIAGDWTNSGTFTKQQGTVTFNGTTQNIISGGTIADKEFYNGQISSGTITISTNNTEFTNNLTINGGTLDLNALTTFVNGNCDISTGGITMDGATDALNIDGNFTVNGGTSTISDGDIFVGGSLSVSGANTFVATTSTPVLEMDGATTPVNISVTGTNNTLGSLKINKSSNVKIVNTSGNVSSLQLNITIGIFNIQANTVSVTDAGVIGVSIYTNGILQMNTTGGILDIAGNFKMNDNSNVTISDGTIYFGNNFYASNTGAAFDPTGGTVIFDRGSKGEIDVDANDNFYHVNISKTSSPWEVKPYDDGSVYGYIKINGNLTVNTGDFSMVSDALDYVALDLNGNITINTNGTFTSGNSANHTIAGNWTNTDGTFLSGTGTITFDGTSTIITGGITDNKDFYNVILNGTSATLSANHIDIDNDFTITNGTWNVYSGGLFYDMYVAGEWINNATFNCVGDVLNVFDDFTDGDYTTNPTWTVQSGDFTAAGFNLRGIDGQNNEKISIPSNQAYGTWEFTYEFEVATTNAIVRFFIIMSPDNANPGGGTTDGYYIWVDGGGIATDFQFRRMDDGVPTTLFTYDWIPGTAQHTVKVTRNMNNQFEVFYDGSSIGTVVDATYTSSAYMGIWTAGNIDNDDQKIDNIKTVGMGGTVTFDGSVTQYVQGTSITTFNNLTINNSTVTTDDGVIMQQSFNIFNTLLMTDGAIDMGNFNIFLKTSGTLSGETNDTRIFTSGAGTGEISATRTLNAPAGVNVAGLGAVLTDATNIGSTTIERGHKAQTGNGNTSINRYYDISSTTAPANATLRTYLFGRELNGQTADANMKLWRSTDGGTNWTNEEGTWTDAVDDYVEKTGITGFSRWAVSHKGTNPLPIELLNFSANCINNSIIISWTTASEINNDYFTIEKNTAENLTNFKKWETVTIIKGSENSNSTTNYEYTDQQTSNLKPQTSNLTQTSNIIYYRLRQTDYNGKYEYFAPIAINCDNENSNTLNITNNNDKITYLFTSADDNMSLLSIYDVTGQIIIKQNLFFEKGINNGQIDISSFSSGIYILQIQTKNKQFFNTKKIIIK